MASIFAMKQPITIYFRNGSKIIMEFKSFAIVDLLSNIIGPIEVVLRGVADNDSAFPNYEWKDDKWEWKKA